MIDRLIWCFLLVLGIAIMVLDDWRTAREGGRSAFFRSRR